MLDSKTNRRQFLTRTGAGLAALSTFDLAFVERASAASMPSHFGRMFPDLPAFGAGLDTASVLADLATLSAPGDPDAPKNSSTSVMVEPGGVDDTLYGAWFTYWGQGFMCHDVSFDQVPQPTSVVRVDRVEDFESVRFDLSQVYGAGLSGSPQLYNGDKFAIANNANGVLDLPRNADGSAIVADPRQDENFITASMQVALQAFHNAIVDLGYPFDVARQKARHFAQWITLKQWLPQLVGQDVVDGLLDGSIPRYYRSGGLLSGLLGGLLQEPAMIPVEWSVAAMRLHPMVRNAYAIQLTTNGAQSFPNNRTTLFSGTGGAPGADDLHGGRPLFESIDWGNFVNELERGDFDPANGTDSFLQAYKQVIPQLGASLFLLPIGGQTGAESSGSINLAFRDLVRGYFYSLPSGQAVAKRYGLDVIDPSDLLENWLPTPIDPATVPSLQSGTPLWLYVLAESYKDNYTHAPNGNSAYLQPNAAKTFGPDQVGDVGARVIADFVLRLLQEDSQGILRPGVDFIPEPPIAPSVGQFGFGDLATFAGVAQAP